MKNIHLNSVDSTNSYLKHNYKSFQNYTFLSTNSQTNGRGRMDRLWESEDSSNLLFSLLILDEKIINHYKEISIVSAYTILEVLQDIGIKDVSIKWPNDVYVKDKKICGILLESVSKERIECLIVGVGLNVNQSQFNGDYLQTPTSIILEKGQEENIEVLKKRIYKKLIENIENIGKKDFYNFIKNYDYLKDKKVYASINNEKKEVTVIGIDKDYSLSIKNKSEVIKLNSDEISFHV